jgi:Ankyrin repeats (3 copies)
VGGGVTPSPPNGIERPAWSLQPAETAGFQSYGNSNVAVSNSSTFPVPPVTVKNPFDDFIAVSSKVPTSEEGAALRPFEQTFGHAVSPTPLLTPVSHSQLPQSDGSFQDLFKNAHNLPSSTKPNESFPVPSTQFPVTAPQGPGPLNANANEMTFQSTRTPSEFATIGAAIGDGPTLSFGVLPHSAAAGSSPSIGCIASLLGGNSKSLSKLIVVDAWDEVEDVVKRNPGTARIWTTRAGFFEGRKDASVLPLHEILVASPAPPLSTVQAVLEAYPEAARARESSYQRFPLHCACRKDASVSVLSIVAAYYKDAVVMPDALGRLPIHYALSNGANQDVVRYLLAVDPRSASGVDQRGWTPLHVACSVGANPEIIKSLIKANPNAVVMQTKKGSTPGKCLNKTVRHRDELKKILSKARHEFDRKFVSPLNKPAREEMDLL